MTYNPNRPNASESPGVFPAQANTNFTRLKTIINADHVFNDKAPMSPSNDGFHRQVHLFARAIPVILDGASAILYACIDSLGRTQLKFYNGVADIQLTPPQELLPIRIVGSESVSAGATVNAYVDPGFRYAGTGWATIENNNIFRFYNILRAGTNDLHELDDNSGSVSRPVFSFSGNNLQITNNDASTRTLTWSLIINRIS